MVCDDSDLETTEKYDYCSGYPAIDELNELCEYDDGFETDSEKTRTSALV